MRCLLTLCLTFFMSSLSANEFCTGAQYRAFDFWIGQWQVTTHSDNIVRFNTISKINDGCTLLEEYTSPSGYSGKSLNIYDRQSNQWHQTWTDNTGLRLQLAGNIKDNIMIMQGVSVNASNQQVINKISWSVNADKTVRQLWQTSTDNGKNWTVVFDGHYQKIKTR